MLKANTVTLANTTIRSNQIESLVIFDSQVADLPLLHKALLPWSIDHTIQPDQDPIDHITHLLTQTGATKLAIVAHGQPGVIQIGNGVIDLDMLNARSGLLQEWGLDSIGIYSCEVGMDQGFIQRLGELTGAQISASTSKIGAGNWELDGGLELLSIGQLADYSGTLATFTGTAGDDVADLTFLIPIIGFTGGTQAELTDAIGDTFVGLDGSDRVRAGEANDTIYGGNGNDNLYSGGGLDIIFGQAGIDYLYGQAGNDIIFGGTGNDSISGNSETDLLYGEEDNDYLYGGDDIDFLFGQAGDDFLYGEAGNDYIFGGIGIDTINGGLGTDEIYGEDGGDIISGNENDDFLFGQAGDDYLYGNAGNDYLVGGEGADQLRGGDGIDQLNGENGDDYLRGENNDDFLYGNDGTDTLDGGAGIDILDGGAGNDNLYGGLGGDVIFGGDGNDSLTGEILPGDPGGVDYLYGGNGNDQLYGFAGADFLIGGAGSDTFYYGAMTEAGDTITDFDPLVGGDQLDFATLFSNLGVPSGSVNTNYLQFFQAGTDTIVKVDQDGTGAAYSFVTMASLSNINTSQLSIGFNVIV